MKTKSIRNQSLKAIAGAALAVALSTSEVTRAADQLAWDKTFRQSDQVIHQKVSFNNRLGINLVADLYVPKNIDRSQKHPAIVVGGPYGAVKEQSAGLYAQTMAERGFVTLAHDPSYNGESGGQPHFTASFEALIEDFSAAVDFLGTKSFVDRERIGVIGVCGSGSFGLAAAETDPRIKAVATVSMYDIGQAHRQGLAEKGGYRCAPKESGRHFEAALGHYNAVRTAGDSVGPRAGWRIDNGRQVEILPVTPIVPVPISMTLERSRDIRRRPFTCEGADGCVITRRAFSTGTSVTTTTQPNRSLQRTCAPPFRSESGEISDANCARHPFTRRTSLSLGRWAEVDGAARTMVIGTPQELTDRSSEIDKEFYDYYRTPRGQHPRSSTAFWKTSGAQMMLFWSFEHLDWISPRPVLFITGDQAHSRIFSEHAFKKASEPKELFVVPNAGHVDLYDRVNLIPWDKLISLFTGHLK